MSNIAIIQPTEEHYSLDTGAIRLRIITTADNAVLSGSCRLTVLKDR